MRILRKAKGHMLLIFVIAAYTVLFIVRPDMGMTSMENSVYYIKEMIMIMPVIFVLTALLDLWIPKEKIIKYLGKDAKIKGIIFSLVLGSISAGPIYAAFPLCVMLHKKGASIRNLVIILSAWAVIKVPMLLNEMKFLGFQFMAVRWVLTVAAIIVFSWIAEKIVKDKDLAQQSEKMQKDVSVNQAACMGCTVCAKSYPELFEIKNAKASIRENTGEIDMKKIAEVAEACPVKAISFIDNGAV